MGGGGVTGGVGTIGGAGTGGLYGGAGTTVGVGKGFGATVLVVLRLSGVTVLVGCTVGICAFAQLNIRQKENAANNECLFFIIVKLCIERHKRIIYSTKLVTSFSH